MGAGWQKSEVTLMLWEETRAELSELSNDTTLDGERGETLTVS